jgi:hypothetical protein
MSKAGSNYMGKALSWAKYVEIAVLLFNRYVNGELICSQVQGNVELRPLV